MSEQNGKTKFEKVQGCRTMLTHTRGGAYALWEDRYKALKIRLFFLIGALARWRPPDLVILGFLSGSRTIDENFNNYLRWQNGEHKQSIEIFLREKTRT